MPSRFSATNGNEFKYQYYPRRKPIAEGWWKHTDAILIGSRTGGGKTRWSFNHALHNSLGRQFGSIMFEVCKSYYLDGEMRSSVMHDKLKEFIPDYEEADLTNFLYKNLTEDDGTVTIDTGEDGKIVTDLVVDFTKEEIQDAFIKELTEQKVEVVYLDNFFSLFPSIRNWNDPSEFLQFVTPLIMKFRRAGITSVWIDHNNKAGDIFGSTAKMIHFDYIFKILHEKEGDRFELEIIKERENLDEQHLCLSFGTDGSVTQEESVRIGIGTTHHFYNFCNDMVGEGQKVTDGSNSAVAKWLLEQYKVCHPQPNYPHLPQVNTVRKKIATLL